MKKSIHIIACIAICAAGCGGGNSNHSAGSSVTGGVTGNVATITVDAGPADAIDAPFISVTICAPGDTTQCRTIDHILVDTGSSGLRIIASVLTPALALPANTDVSGNTIVECTQFADGYSWGPVRYADLAVADEHANRIPVQIIGESSFSALVPTTCSSSGPAENDVQAFGANGIIGIGPFIEDCGSFCASGPAQPGFYYACSNTSCQPASVALAQQVSNPVAFFSVDNNGVLVQLPAVPAIGASTATGSLIFGIGTQGNNSLNGASVFMLDPATGYFATTYKGVAYSNSYIDSGSNALYFNDAGIAVCSQTSMAPGFYCPAVTLALSAINSDSHGMSGAVNFSVANADRLITNNITFNAYANLAAPNPDPMGFGWGLPFFFGRHVFTAMERKTTTAGVGPYFAYY